MTMIIIIIIMMWMINILCLWLLPKEYDDDYNKDNDDVYDDDGDNDDYNNHDNSHEKYSIYMWWIHHPHHFLFLSKQD